MAGRVHPRLLTGVRGQAWPWSGTQRMDSMQKERKGTSFIACWGFVKNYLSDEVIAVEKPQLTPSIGR